MSESRKAYFIGIEGAGTSALAVMYKKMGFDVSGSDEGDHMYREILTSNVIETFDKYNSKNVPSDADIVVYSTSVKEKNPELKFAIKKSKKCLSYPEALAEIFNQRNGIAVCGTHGKTTTAAMLATVLDKLGSSPSAIVGSKVLEWGENSLAGEGEYFVIEADEYQNKLKYYHPCYAILTSVDYDHPDFFETFDEYKKVFVEFVEKLPNHGLLVYYNDSSSVVDVVNGASSRRVSYGFLSDSDYRIDNLEIKESLDEFGIKIQGFEVFFKENSLGKFEIKFPGKHNVLNATAVIAMTHKLGFEIEEIREALRSFQGTARRFQYIGEKKGAVVLDDYAHHPEEVKTTLETVRNLFDDKEIIAVFHPHSFSRTEVLLSEFSQSFEDADELIVLDIFGSVREESGNVSSADLVQLVNKYSPGKAVNIHTKEEVVKYLKKKLDDNKVIVSMGAGDVWKVARELVK